MQAIYTINDKNLEQIHGAMYLTRIFANDEMDQAIWQYTTYDRKVLEHTLRCANVFNHAIRDLVISNKVQ